MTPKPPEREAASPVEGMVLEVEEDEDPELEELPEPELPEPELPLDPEPEVDVPLVELLPRPEESTCSRRPWSTNWRRFVCRTWRHQRRPLQGQLV